MEERQLAIWEDKINQFPTPYNDLVDLSPSFQVQSAFIKHYRKFHGYDTFSVYKRILVAVSGGSDSDILVDMIERIGYPDGAVKYVFCNTGIEFQATKDHIKDIEEKYGISIEEKRAKMPTTIACKRYGQPVLSKQVSEWIARLQRHNFKWEDRPFEELLAEYPKCKAALQWWCNKFGDGSQLNISRRKYLKEFMVANPPTFQISNKCCQKSKKETMKSVSEEFNPDLDVQGIRKGEGGARAVAYKSCFDDMQFGCSRLRPLFWFLDDDKELYCQTFDVEHSRCYTQYGLKRTGCACCPFGRDFEQELEAAKKYEPNLYKVAVATFGDSYEYTRKYMKFREEKAREEASTNGDDNVSFFD